MGMKKTIGVLLCFAFLTLALPCLALLGKANPADSSGQTDTSSPQASATAAPDSTTNPADDLLVLDRSSGKVLTLSVRDFLIGSVASELPISYQKEAFKAQTVAIHSYALANKAIQLKTPDASLKGAYLSVDPTTREGYLSDSVLHSLWGSNYDANYAYVSAAVDEVLQQVLYYDDAPALTTYYAISNGSSESSENVWSTALPYLVKVDLPLDKTSPDYEVSIELSAQEVSDKLKMAFTALDLSGSPSGWFGAAQRSPSGYILTILCGGQTLKGLDVRTALGLRSADFDVSCDENNRFTFKTRGYGHGVGMSQYSANTLAVTGKTYDEILSVFYPGTTLKTLS